MRDTPSAPRVLCGRMFWQQGLPLYINREREFFWLPLHAHDFIEINYVAEGKGFHYIEAERIEVERGDLFIIPVGTRHVYRPESMRSDKKLIVYNCLIGPELLEQLLLFQPLPEGITRLFPTAGYRFFQDRRNAFRHTVEKLFEEHTLQLPGYETVVCNLLLQLFVSLYRCSETGHDLLGQTPGPGSSSGLRAISTHQLEPVFDYIAAHCEHNLTLAQLASLIPISVSHLQRLFKQATGQSFTEYIQNSRIEKSCELLQRTSLAIRDIAAQVGYKDLKFFHALFKKKTGTTPYRYRQSVR